MYWLLLATFVLGYVFIALEHTIRVDKAATALITGVTCWTILLFGRFTLLADVPELAGHLEESVEFLDHTLLEHVGEIAEILFFLMAAMTIVELIDAHRGFQVVTDRISTTGRVRLLWIVCAITFFFSAALDNLTTAIVIAALLKKLLADRDDVLLFGGMVVVAANAGGAWSPIGDVTTIMLWIGGQVTALNIVAEVLVPSLLSLLVPLGVVSLRLKGDVTRPKARERLGSESHAAASSLEQKTALFLGLGGLLFVPIYKSVTHLPPFMGMLFSLGVMWVTIELASFRKERRDRNSLAVADVMRRIDMSSILFFLGILLAVASLQTAGVLADLATLLNERLGDVYLINTVVGLLSAVIDNVPLVAGAMGMYSLTEYPTDSVFWELLAFCAGTGGSVLIIGSAAGVAIMGLLRIDFVWYLRHISALALLGYLVGVAYMYLVG